MLINKAFVIPPLAAHKGGRDRQLCAGVGSREMPQRDDHPSISPRTNSREMSFPAQPCPPVLAKERKKTPPVSLGCIWLSALTGPLLS